MHILEKCPHFTRKSPLHLQRPVPLESLFGLLVLSRSFQSTWRIIFTSSLLLKDLREAGSVHTDFPWSDGSGSLLSLLWLPCHPFVYILCSVQVSLQWTHLGPGTGPPVPPRCLLYPAILQGPAANVSKEVCDLKLRSIYHYSWLSWSLFNSDVESTLDPAGHLHCLQQLVLSRLRSFVWIQKTTLSGNLNLPVCQFNNNVTISRHDNIVAVQITAAKKTPKTINEWPNGQKWMPVWLEP